MPKLTSATAQLSRRSLNLSLVDLAGSDFNSAPALTLPPRPEALPPSSVPPSSAALTAPLTAPITAPLTAPQDPAPSSAALSSTPAALQPEQIAPLITPEQLALVTSGLEALSQPLLKYLDPEERYQIVRHNSVDHDFQHLTLALKHSPSPSARPDLSPVPHQSIAPKQRAVASKRAAASMSAAASTSAAASNSAAASKNAATSTGTRPDVARYERSPEQNSSNDLLLTTLDSTTLVLPSTPPQPISNCSFFSGTPKATELQSWRNPAYHTAVPSSSLPEGKQLVRTPQGLMRLDPDCNLLLDVYGLLFQHTGFCTLPIFTSAEQHQAQPYYDCLNQAAQRYRELFALFYYSVGGLSLEQSRCQLYRELYADHDHCSSSLSQALSERSAERAFLEQQRAAPSTTLVGAGVPQLIIGQYQEWTRRHPAPSVLTPLTPMSASELVGTPHQWWGQERSSSSRYLHDKTPDCDLTLDYLCAGFKRLCYAPEQVQALVASLQPWEVVVDASSLERYLSTGLGAKVQAQRLHRNDPTHQAQLTPPQVSLTELNDIEQLKPKSEPASPDLVAQLAGGCYWGHEVKLYALPSIMAPGPEVTTPLSLLSAWESERVATYWQHLEQLSTYPDAPYYPQLFSHDGIPWYSATQRLMQSPMPNPSYDGSEHSRRALTGQMARDYSLEQSLTYSAGQEQKLAAILAEPHSILRTYLSEAARSVATPLLRESQLFLAPQDKRPIPDYETLQIKLMAQSGLSFELCAYYGTTTRRKLNQLVAKTSAAPKAAPQKAQALKAAPNKALAPKAELIKNQLPNAQAPQAHAPKAQAYKAQAPKATPPQEKLLAARLTKAAPKKARPTKAQAPKAPPLHDLLNQPTTALYLMALIRHYYTELRLQGLLYQEHIRLPLTELNVGPTQMELTSPLLRLVLTALSARPDLHFCGARLGKPFALSARPQRANRAAHQERRLNLTHFDSVPSGRRTRGHRVVSCDLRLNPPQEQRAPEAREPLYCDLSLYFTKPSTELERAQNLAPQLKRSAQALERPSSELYRRSFAALSQRSNLEQALPLWTREQVSTTKVYRPLSHPLTFIQNYVCTQLQHGRSFRPQAPQIEHQAFSCPEFNAYCANPHGTYQGQINLFLAAAVYQSAQELSHLATLPAIGPGTSPAHAVNPAPSVTPAHSARTVSPNFPSFGLFLYALEALENQEALAVQCQCGHSSIVFNPQLDPRPLEHEQLCPHCHSNLTL